MSQEKICKHYFVSGTVQGVWYRASTCKKAQELALTGWVKNIDDGRVELVACGSKESLTQLELWLWQGPSAAKVSDIDISSTPFEVFSEFIQR